MSYFSHAFKKSFLMSSFVEKGKGKLGTTGNILATGELAIVNAKTWNIFDTTYATANPGCCNIILANGPLYSKDKIGPFHGGYLESNKSKEINAKYVSRLYTVEANLPQQMVVNIGHTPFNGSTGSCCKEFMCGETYSLRLDLKGSPALRFLDHNAYLIASAYTGCCPDGSIAPVAVDSTLVMIEWAKAIVNSPLISPFVLPVVVAEDGTVYYAPGTLDDAGQPWANTWDTYVSPGHVDGECAGLILYGAYVDTKFGDCSFQVSDFYEKEPIRIYASEVDLNGDPCAFDGICVVTECEGVQANGFGETVLRDMILSERYRQNFFANDIRIREITQGNQVVSDVDRTKWYDRLFLLHNVPRFNNPSSTFDNDQYLLEVNALASGNGTPSGTLNSSVTALYNWLNSWLGDCGSQCNVEQFEGETSCTPEVPPVPEN